MGIGERNGWKMNPLWPPQHCPCGTGLMDPETTMVDTKVFLTGSCSDQVGPFFACRAVAAGRMVFKKISVLSANINNAQQGEVSTPRVSPLVDEYLGRSYPRSDV